MLPHMVVWVLFCDSVQPGAVGMSGWWWVGGRGGWRRPSDHLALCVVGGREDNLGGAAACVVETYPDPCPPPSFAHVSAGSSWCVCMCVRACACACAHAYVCSESLLAIILVEIAV
jgi:hypothetical protein